MRAAGIAVEDPEAFADNVTLDVPPQEGAARAAGPTGGQAPSRLPGRVAARQPPPAFLVI